MKTPNYNSDKDHRSLSDAVKKEYDQQSDCYELKWSAYLNHTYSRAVDMMAPEDGDYILDSSAGTGLFGSMLLEHARCRLVLSDFSESMLKVAKERHTGDNDGVSIVRADTHQLPFDDDLFDKIYNINALHFYANPVMALDELVRVCKPGGHILILDWSRDYFLFRMFETAMRLFRVPTGRVFHKEELENLFREKGLTVRKACYWRWHYWSLASLKAELPL